MYFKPYDNLVKRAEENSSQDDEIRNDSETLITLLAIELIIRIEAYKQEWKYFEKIENGQDKKKVEILTKVCKPIWVRIDEYTDMKEFRDTCLAHNFRLRKNNDYYCIFTLPKKEYTKLPSTLNEFFLLTELIYCMTNIVKVLFNEEFIESQKNTAQIYNPKRQNNIEIDFRNELATILISAVEISNSLPKNYGLDVQINRHISKWS